LRSIAEVADGMSMFSFVVFYLRDFHWDSPSGCVINVSSEEVGNKKIEDQGNIIDVGVASRL
jgi:hypothetical protein